MLKCVVSGLVLAALNIPVAAAEYWVVKDPATHTCVIVQQRPATPAIRHAFDRREAAEAAIARSVTCGGVD